MKSRQNYDPPAAIVRIFNVRKINRLFHHFLSAVKRCISQAVSPFVKLATSTTVILALAAWSARPVYADHFNFTFSNESGKTIVDLYVSPAYSDFWGEDVLGQSVLPSREHTRVNFPDQDANSPCFWDIKAVYEDGTSAEKQSHNLCQGDNSVVAPEADRSAPNTGGSGNNDDCESQYRLFEDRMCYCHGMCGLNF
jgi:hypothetical protein